jgi:hypothetical protein
MTLTDQIRAALKSLPVAPQYLIPCENTRAAQVIAKREAGKWGVKIATFTADGAIIIVRVE